MQLDSINNPNLFKLLRSQDGQGICTKHIESSHIEMDACELTKFLIVFHFNRIGTYYDHSNANVSDIRYKCNDSRLSL